MATGAEVRARRARLAISDLGASASARGPGRVVLVLETVPATMDFPELETARATQVSDSMIARSVVRVTQAATSAVPTDSVLTVRHATVLVSATPTRPQGFGPRRVAATASLTTMVPTARHCVLASMAHSAVGMVLAATALLELASVHAVKGGQGQTAQLSATAAV